MFKFVCLVANVIQQTAWSFNIISLCKGHSLPNHTAMSPLITDFDENLSAYGADHSEQNDTYLSKIGSAAPKIQEFEN